MPDTAPGKHCPNCGKPADARWRPFCCKRCADVDLNRWLSGTYTVPVVEDDEDVTTVPKPGEEPSGR